MAHFAVVVPTLALASLVALACTLLLGGALGTASGRAGLVSFLGGQERHPLAWACSVAAVATVGSLYLSEVVGFVPCLLCWYQRICMYPLSVILLVAAIRRDRAVRWYVVPLAAVGTVISTYHYAIEWRPSLEAGACGIASYTLPLRKYIDDIGPPMKSRSAALSPARLSPSALRIGLREPSAASA